MTVYIGNFIKASVQVIRNEGRNVLSTALLGAMISTPSAIFSRIPNDAAFSFGASLGALFHITSISETSSRLILLASFITTFVTPFFISNLFIEKSLDAWQIPVHLISCCAVFQLVGYEQKSKKA